MTPGNQIQAFSTIKKFYMEVALRLKQYLPFENKLLRYCSAVCPTQQKSKKLEKKLVFLSKQLPSVVPSDDVAKLRLEVRVHQTNSSSGDSSDVTSYWTAIMRTGKFPVLTKLVRALLVLPHGNSDVERVFSNLADVVQKKRQSLSAETISALVVSRSCLLVKGWTPSTMPVTNDLIQLAELAYSKAKAKAEEKKKDDERKRNETYEKELVEEIEKDKKKCKNLANLYEEEMSVEKELDAKLKERQRTQQLIAELTASASKVDAEFDELQKQKTSILRKRSIENDKIVQSVLKRFVADHPTTSKQ